MNKAKIRRTTATLALSIVLVLGTVHGAKRGSDPGQPTLGYAARHVEGEFEDAVLAASLGFGMLFSADELHHVRDDDVYVVATRPGTDGSCEAIVRRDPDGGVDLFIVFAVNRVDEDKLSPREAAENLLSPIVAAMQAGTEERRDR